jgi:predicted transcriptional regulator
MGRITGQRAMTRTAPFSMRLPPDLKERLQQLADRDHRSLTNYIEVLLLQHVEKKPASARGESETAGD